MNTHLADVGAYVTLRVLSVAMGLTNVDPAPTMGKGIVGHVRIVHDGEAKNVSRCTDITDQSWTMVWPLVGEAQQIYSPGRVASVTWHPLATVPPAAVATWFRFAIDLPQSAPLAMVDPNQTSYALDLTGLNKGIAFVNGFNIGRYWLTSSSGCQDGECAPPDFPGPMCYFRFKNCGHPTQHLYHVPTGILTEKDNLVVFFEETDGVQNPRHFDRVALVALRDHPLPSRTAPLRTVGV